MLVGHLMREEVEKVVEVNERGEVRERSRRGLRWYERDGWRWRKDPEKSGPTKRRDECMKLNSGCRKGCDGHGRKSVDYLEILRYERKSIDIWIPCLWRGCVGYRLRLGSRREYRLRGIWTKWLAGMENSWRQITLMLQQGERRLLLGRRWLVDDLGGEDWRSRLESCGIRH